MTRPRILAFFMALTLMACKETSPQVDRPVEGSRPDPSITAPEKENRDSLRMRPAKRELHKKDGVRRKKGLDTLKPVTT